MNPAYLIGLFLGSAAAVTLLTLVIGAFIKRPLLPVAIGTGMATLLSVVGNDGLEPASLVATLLAGSLLATWRVFRQPDEQQPSPRVAARSSASRSYSRPQPIRVKNRLFHKLYLSAFWGLLVVCGGLALGTALMNLHDYLVVEESVDCWNNKGSFPQCGIHQREWGDRDIYSIRTWLNGDISVNAQSERFFYMLMSPLWFIPLALLVAVHRWVVWLMRPEPVVPDQWE